jgi:HEAT repeat protein
MPVRKVEHELEVLSKLREAPAEEALPALRKALKDPVNMMAAKAAGIIAGRRFSDATPDLLRAFERLFGDPVRRDPQCWGKNAIAKALVELEWREAAPYLRGMRHIQMEPVWGGEADTAGSLRGICVLGLAACRDLRREEVLRALVDGAADTSDPVRVEVFRAIAQMGGDEGELLLRLKAQVGDVSPAVMGQVFDCLLAVEGERGLEFVAGFLERGAVEVREEAALSLGSSRMAEAVTVLLATWEKQIELRDVVLRALSISRQEAAFEFLLALVRDGRMADAKAAAEALSIHETMREQVEAAMRER